MGADTNYGTQACQNKKVKVPKIDVTPEEAKKFLADGIYLNWRKGKAPVVRGTRIEKLAGRSDNVIVKVISLGTLPMDESKNAFKELKLV